MPQMRIGQITQDMQACNVFVHGNVGAGWPTCTAAATGPARFMAADTRLLLRACLGLPGLAVDCVAVGLALSPP